MGEQETTKRKYLIIVLLPLLLCSFLSVGFSQIVSDTSIISMGGKDWSLKVDSVLASSIDSRNTPYMTAKSSTEKELFLELATLEDCKSGVVQFKIDMAGLTAYKQLPLTQEEIDAGSFRPKNVENSFALFDLNGKKVAHIYGSKITDSKGTEIWLDQDLENGLLTVILPKPEVLETLSFPLLLDPTFGYTTVGGSTGGNDATILGSPYELTENASVYSMSCYITGEDVNLQMAIYSSDGSSLIANTSTQLFSGGGAGWKTINFSTPIELSNGTYYLVSNKDTSTTFAIAYDAYSPSAMINQAQTFGEWSANVTPTGWNAKMSIFANYTTEPEATPTPTPTPFVSATPFPEGAMDDTDWWISILVLILIIINLVLMTLPFALVRFTFGILSLFLCMLALSYQVPLSPYLQTAGLLISALAMLFSVRARE